jgi:predicted transcriptional regulator
MTQKQSDALSLFGSGPLRSSRKHQKVFSELAREGFLMATHRNRRRVYIITAKGRRAQLQEAA